MSGYKWDPVIRVVYFNGGEAVYWFSDRLTDLGQHTKVELSYPEVQEIVEDLNRSLRPVIYGVRPEVSIFVHILSMADQMFLAEIETALLSPELCSVYLSLDGGVVDREVVIAAPVPMDPIRGKTYIGATFTLSLRCKDVITQKPSMATPPTPPHNLLNNGTFDDLPDANVLTNSGFETGLISPWIAGGGAFGTASIVSTANTLEGTYCLQLARTSGPGGFNTIQNKTGFVSGKWYMLTARYRNLAAEIQAQIALTVTSGAIVGWQYNPVTDLWQVGAVDVLLTTNLGTAWQFIEVPVLISASIAVGDTIQVQLISPTAATTGTLFFDEVEFHGPFNQPGRYPQGWSINQPADIQLTNSVVPQAYSDRGVKVEKIGNNANYISFYHIADFPMKANAWYRLQGKGKAPIIVNNGFGIQIWNNSYPASSGSNPLSLYKDSPKTGDSLNTWAYYATVNQDLNGLVPFKDIDVYFRGPDVRKQPTLQPFKSSDRFMLRIHGIQTFGDYCWYDNVFVTGPVLRPGVATW